MATYSVQTASPPAYITAHHDYVVNAQHRAQFASFEPPVATALVPTTNTTTTTPPVNNNGSDCGSSSGLGGMKLTESTAVSTDDSSNNDGEDSSGGGVGDEDITTANNTTTTANASGRGDGWTAAASSTTTTSTIGMSSKQSATSSSGKGSSNSSRINNNNNSRPRVGTSPSSRRPRTLHVHHHHHSSPPSTSSTANGDGGSGGGAMTEIPSSTQHPPPSIYPLTTSRPPPPLYTMTVSAAGQLVDISQQQSRSTMAGGTGGSSTGGNSNMVTTNCLGSSTVGGSNANGVTAAATSSASCGGGAASDSLAQPAGPVVTANSTTQRSCNDVYVHVQPGETLAIRVGTDIQHICGPATVRMVSQNGVAPSALPLHVPPGHMIQQIVDEQGILRHLILSPETTPTSLIQNGPFGTVPPPPTINPNTPVPPPSQHTTTSGTTTPQKQSSTTTTTYQQQSASSPPPSSLLHQSPVVPPFPPPVHPIHLHHHQQHHHNNPASHSVVVAAALDIVDSSSSPHHVVGLYDTATTVGYHHQTSSYPPHQSATHHHHHWSPPPPGVIIPLLPKPTHTAVSDGYVVVVDDQDTSQNSQSGASCCVEDEETEKIKEMLNRIQSPQVLQVGARDAEISWQELDTSEASASGGPFPQIDASEFTYEIVLFENKPQGRTVGNYRCTPDQGNQLRLMHLKPDTDYFVHLRALLAERGLLGDPSAPIGFKTKPCHPDTPLPPRLLKRGKTFFTLLWKRSCDNGAKITKFILEMEPARCGSSENGRPQFEKVYEGHLEQTKVSNLQPNTLYRFRVSAINEHGKSEPSDVLLVQTNGTAPLTPDPPQLVSATATSLQLAWTCRTGDDWFTLQMEDPSNSYGFLPYCANTTETTASVNDLARNSEYNFRLIAQNDEGASHPSEAVTYRTMSDRPNPPSKPYLKERVKSTWICLTWDAPKDTGGAEITGYQLDYAPELPISNQESAPVWKSLYNGSARTFSVHDLEPGRSYMFRVNANGPAGPSAWSDSLIVSTTPVAPGPCPMPEMVGRPKPTSLRIRWGQPTSTGGAPITEYHVSCRESGKILYRGPKTDCQIGDLLPGRTIWVQVRACNRAGNGNWSDALEMRTAAGPPDPPTELRLSSAPGEKSLSLTWNPPQETNGASITEYRLLKAIRRLSAMDTNEFCTTTNDSISTSGGYKSPSTTTTITSVRPSISSSIPDSPSSSCSSPSTPISAAMVASELDEFVVVYSGAALNAEVRNLSPANEYAFKVQAVNASGVSASSRPLLVRTLAAVPTAPGKLQVSAISTTELHVSWDESCDNGSSLLNYQICVSSSDTNDTMRSTSSIPTVQLPPHILEHVLDDLKPETSYRVRVLAVNAIGMGPWTMATCSTFSMPPPPPALECVSVGAQSLKLRWTDTKVSTPGHDYAFYYYLEKENDTGSFSPVYEGDSKCAKVKNLNESTKYRFRIRASCRTGGMGAWSEPIEFSTSRLPPPSIKTPPRYTEVAHGSYQIEWSSVRVNSSTGGYAPTDRMFYRLQTAPGVTRGADRPEDWTTVYQGSAQSYTLSDLTSSSLRVRVIAVRQSTIISDDERSGGIVDETCSQPSPFVLINTSSGSNASLKTRRTSDTNDLTASSSNSNGDIDSYDDVDGGKKETQLSDGHWAIIILVGFSLLALLLAFFVQSYMGGSTV